MILLLHIFAVCFSLCVAAYSDHMGFQWARGKKDYLDAKKLRRLHALMWVGLFALIITGGFLFWPAHQYLLSRPQFLVKMTFVTALIINGLVIGNLLCISSEKKFSELTTKQKLPLFISGMISTVSWVAALILAFFIFPN